MSPFDEVFLSHRVKAALHSILSGPQTRKFWDLLVKLRAGNFSAAGMNVERLHSRSGKVSSYALEKRNHPKNKRDPMICLDGTCYVTYYNKPAW